MLRRARKPSKKVRLFIERHAMVKNARGVVVAVSGGPDSVATLDLLVQLNLGLPLPFRFHVAHLNHNLRGRESDDDAEFVRALAKRLRLDLTISSVDVRAVSQKSKRGLEETAREIRYGFLASVARESGCDRIATGHTMTDQAETFIMRLARGAGLRGLAAMRPVSALPVFPAKINGGGDGEKGRRGEVAPSPRHPVTPSPLLIRPLLCLTREEVEEYCRERSLEFRVDATNLETDYTRNRVRLEVMPALRKVNPRVVESIARAAAIIACDQDALDQLSSALLGSGVKEQQSSTPRLVCSVQALLDQPVGLRRRMIFEAIMRCRLAMGEGERSEGFTTQIDSTHVASVEALLASQMSGKHIVLPDGLEVWRDFGDLVFTFSIARTGPAVAYKLELSRELPPVRAGGLKLSFERGESLTAALDEAKRAKKSARRDWMVVALDASKLPKRMIVRPRVEGESARVVGHHKTKKLKNLMIDHRIPSSLRARWPVVTTPDDRYVWSPGLPPALEFAASDETVGLAILRASDA